jgi:hypothetical protein
MSLSFTIFLIGVGLLPFSAWYRPDSLGYFASTPASFFILSSLIFFTFERKSFVPSYLFYLFVLATFMSIGGFFVFGYDGFYLEKSIKLFILSLLWLSPLLYQRCFSVEIIQKLWYWYLLVNIAGIFLYDLNLVPFADSIKPFFFSSKYLYLPDLRPRAFTQEASHLSFILSISFLGAYLCITRNIVRKGWRYISLLIPVALLSALGLFIGSKFLIAIPVFSLLFTLLVKSNSRLSWISLFIFIILFAPFAIRIFPELNSSLLQDIYYFSSFATRLCVSLAGFFAAFINPLGFGFYGFYPALSEIALNLVHLILRFSPSSSILNLNEVLIIMSEYSNVSTKSILLDFGVVFGFPFYYFLFVFVRKINFSSMIAVYSFSVIILGSLFVSGFQSIIFFIALINLRILFPARRSLNAPLVSKHS